MWNRGGLSVAQDKVSESQSPMLQALKKDKKLSELRETLIHLVRYSLSAGCSLKRSTYHFLIQLTESFPP